MIGGMEGRKEGRGRGEGVFYVRIIVGVVINDCSDCIFIFWIGDFLVI